MTHDRQQPSRDLALRSLTESSDQQYEMPFGIPVATSASSRAGTRVQGRSPYAVLLIDLEEGPRMISTYTGGKPEEVTFDMAVTLVCEGIDDDVTLPRFKRA